MIEEKWWLTEKRRAYKRKHQREWAKRNPDSVNASLLLYRLSMKGYFANVYKRMRLRVAGKFKARYKGLEIMTPSEWKQFLFDTEFIRKSLLYNYIASGRDRKLAPSIDRIDSRLGYTFGNCQWLTQSENGVKGNQIDRRSRAHGR